MIFHSYVKLPEGNSAFLPLKPGFYDFLYLFVPFECSILSISLISMQWPNISAISSSVATQIAGFPCQSQLACGWIKPHWESFEIPWRILTVLLEIWCSMDPINVSPSHVSIFLPAPAGSVMGRPEIFLTQLRRWNYSPTQLRCTLIPSGKLTWLWKITIFNR